MGGCNEVDIAAAVILQLEHRLGQLLNGHFTAEAMVADIEILTEDTAEVTAGEEYSARPTAADKDAFLAKMWAYRADDRQSGNTAEANLPFVSVDFALSRTEHAGIGHIPQLFHGFTESAQIR